MTTADFAISDAALERVSFGQLPGFQEVGLGAAWRAFCLSLQALTIGARPLRPARSMPKAWLDQLRALADGPQSADDEQAQELFRAGFVPYRVHSKAGAFFTGYFEPEVRGSLTRAEGFSEPILGRPQDLETFPPGLFPLGDRFSAGQRQANGALAPFPTRRDLEEGGLASARPIVWARDGAEAFKIHVQGSARVRLADGAITRLTYAGRNGRPYTSIGKILATELQIPPSDISPERLYRWIRINGQGPGEPGRLLMQRNESYIFFELNSALDPARGPIGGASLPLTPLRSIAIDRGVWPYGLPYWISSDWSFEKSQPFQQMLIGQDTGAAIVGPARADIFLGSGAEAGCRAGEIRHGGEMFVLLPREAAGA